MKIYIAGPMRGIAEFNFPAFFAAEELLKADGHTVFNPARRDEEAHGVGFADGNTTGDEVAAAQKGFSLREALKDDTSWIALNAEGIYLLPGWENSKGARAEKALADALGLDIQFAPGAAPKLETDPNGLGAGQPGAKLDAGKSPVFRGVLQYFPRAVLAVGGLSLYGANKYTWEGWRTVPDGIGRYGDALGRHAAKEAIEGLWDMEVVNDPKYPANVLHATAVAWNALARLELIIEKMEKK